MDELRQHKSSDKIKWFLTLIAFLLVGATIAGMLLGYLTPRTRDEEPAQQEQEANLNNGGLIVNESVDNGISLMSVRLMPNEYASYGVSKSAESAFIINATITPDYAENQGVSWEVFWLHGGEEFASNNDVNDFITVTPSEESSLSATVECLAPFGSKIVLKATSQDNPSAEAHCELDYAQKVLSAYLGIGDITVNFDGVTNIQYELSPTEFGSGGHIYGDFELSEVYTIKQNFVESVTFTNSSNSSEWFSLDGGYPQGIRLFSEPNKNWVGEHYYFDYVNDASGWFITPRIDFSTATTAEIISYFSNITNSRLATINYTLEGEYDTFTFSSTLNVTGFTNSTPVNNLQFDRDSYVF